MGKGIRNPLSRVVFWSGRCEEGQSLIELQFLGLPPRSLVAVLTDLPSNLMPNSDILRNQNYYYETRVSRSDEYENLGLMGCDAV